MSDSRTRILGRLRANRPQATSPPAVYQKPLGWDCERRITAFSERMQAVRGEVHRLARDDWAAWLGDELARRGQQRGLIGRGPVAEAFATAAADRLTLERYEHPIDDWKQRLFNDVEFSVTGARAGLAETGSLVLWPDADEPRLMSLVPPLHIAVLETDRLYENFAEMIAAENWAAGMPTNALLISGPSKTADIEQTLAYGIHGPKQLITLLIG
jgi:L-lactate dehydrogenase complex protein LldG